MSQFVASAIFDSNSQASEAVRDLRDAGIPDSAISMIAQDGDKTSMTTGNGNPVDENDGNMARGLLGGGALGAGLAVAALAIPGVGPLVAAGAIAASAVPTAMVAGAALGAFAGGLNEGLMKHGVTREDADYYDNGISSGGTLVAVNDTMTGVSISEVQAILHRNGGHNSTQSRMAAAN